jgi:hypothetical protein
MLCSCMGAFPGKESGIQVWAGLAPRNQTVGSLLRTPWPAKPAVKMIVPTLIFIYFQTYILGVGILHSCMGTFPRKEGGIQVLAGLAQCIQTVGSFLRTPGWQSLRYK